MLEPIPFAGMVEIEESFDRTASHMAGEYVPYNEPVAWINLDRFKDEALYLADCVSENEVENMGITTPLYTHPVKKLTDEEIQEVAHGFGAIGWMGDTTYEFARAILRKAQEK
jgi:hypothetical protein